MPRTAGEAPRRRVTERKIGTPNSRPSSAAQMRGLPARRAAAGWRRGRNSAEKPEEESGERRDARRDPLRRGCSPVGLPPRSRFCQASVLDRVTSSRLPHERAAHASTCWKSQGFGRRQVAHRRGDGGGDVRPAAVDLARDDGAALPLRRARRADARRGDGRGTGRALLAAHERRVSRARRRERSTRTSIAASPSPSRGAPARRRSAARAARPRRRRRFVRRRPLSPGARGRSSWRAPPRPHLRRRNEIDIGPAAKRRASSRRALTGKSPGRRLIAVGGALRCAPLLLWSLEASLARRVSFDVRKLSQLVLPCALGVCTLVAGAAGVARAEPAPAEAPHVQPPVGARGEPTAVPGRGAGGEGGRGGDRHDHARPATSAASS